MDLNEAKKTASRCLECKNPKCTEGCPINQNIPKFIKYIKEENLELAYKTIIKNKKNCTRNKRVQLCFTFKFYYNIIKDSYKRIYTKEEELKWQKISGENI